MDTKLILIFLLALIIYTLYWTWSNDFGIFLLISIILLTGLFVYIYINDKIKYIEDKIIYIEDKINNVVDEQIQNINNIKSNIVGEQLTNIKNIKSSFFS